MFRAWPSVAMIGYLFQRGIISITQLLVCVKCYDFLMTWCEGGLGCVDGDHYCGITGRISGVYRAGDHLLS